MDGSRNCSEYFPYDTTQECSGHGSCLPIQNFSNPAALPPKIQEVGFYCRCDADWTGYGDLNTYMNMDPIAQTKCDIQISRLYNIWFASFAICIFVLTECILHTIFLDGVKSLEKLRHVKFFSRIGARVCRIFVVTVFLLCALVRIVPHSTVPGRIDSLGEDWVVTVLQALGNIFLFFFLPFHHSVCVQRTVQEASKKKERKALHFAFWGNLRTFHKFVFISYGVGLLLIQCILIGALFFQRFELDFGVAFMYGMAVLALATPTFSNELTIKPMLRELKKMMGNESEQISEESETPRLTVVKSLRNTLIPAKKRSTVAPARKMYMQEHFKILYSDVKRIRIRSYLNTIPTSVIMIMASNTPWWLSVVSYNTAAINIISALVVMQLNITDHVSNMKVKRVKALCGVQSESVTNRYTTNEASSAVSQGLSEAFGDGDE